VVATVSGNGILNLAWITRSDRYYQVERTLDLRSAAWTIIDSALQGTGGIMNWSTPVTGTGGKAFYRVFEYVD
jgi:hypothetical protein